ncbi:cupin domain-containing protein [Gemmatimonadota bacterium]
MPEITLNTDQMAWEEDHSYPSGAMTKVLRDEGGMRLILLKLPPGFRMEAHTHMFGEQHYVLEGEYETGGKEYGPGTYQYIPAHTDHGPYTSRDGAAILLIWEGSALLHVGV